MTVAQSIVIVLSITAFSTTGAVLCLRDRRPDVRRRGWAYAGLALFGLLCLSIGLWGPHAGEHHDYRPGHMRTGEHLKP
jgi:hypothetical protein